MLLLAGTHSFHLPRRLVERYTFSISEDYPSYPPEDDVDPMMNNNGVERLSDEELRTTLGEWEELDRIPCGRWQSRGQRQFG